MATRPTAGFVKLDMSKYKFVVLSRYSGEQGHLPGSDIRRVVETNDLNEAFKVCDKANGNYQDAWVSIVRRKS